MKTIGPWLVPFIFSILLNILFFSLMPLMTDQDGDIHINSLTSSKRINLVRIEKHDPEEIKEVKKRPEKEKKEVDKPIDQKPVTFPKRSAQDLPGLDFKVNLNIPVTKGLAPFPLEKVEFDLHPMEKTSGTETINKPHTIEQMDKTYTTEDIDNTITPITKTPPIYPFQAKRRGIEGWVKVKFLVNIDGMVEKISIVESEPEAVFEESVLDTLPKWRFTPGTMEGIKVNTWVITTIRFELKQ